MTRKFIGGATSLVAAGLLLLSFAPTRAAPAAESDAAVEQVSTSAKPSTLIKAKAARTHKASRSHKAAKVVALKNQKARPLRKDAKAADPSEPQMPASVANANALMQATDARGSAAISETPLEAAAAEQLDELGKSLTAPAEEPRQMAQVAVTDRPQPAPFAASEPTRPLKQARVTSSDDAWTQSSLIGKLFIAIGGMLTLASAARMLVA